MERFVEFLYHAEESIGAARCILHGFCWSHGISARGTQFHRTKTALKG